MTHPEEVEDMLISVLGELSQLDEESLDDIGMPEEAGDIDSVRTFSDAMVLTDDSGIVIRSGDAEFQVTIVRSR